MQRLETLAGLNGGATTCVPAPTGDALSRVAFQGDGILGLLDSKPPAPVYPGIPPAGHFTLLVAPSFSGKTSLALYVSMARTAGVAPWQGAPVLEQGRAVHFSIDESPQQLAWRLKSLARTHPGGRSLSVYADRLALVGPHASVSPADLDALRFTDEGLALIAQVIEGAAAAGQPFREVYFDAYSDFLPLGVSDADNQEATRIGGALERIAVTTGTAIIVIHHAGKPVPGALSAPDPRDLGRGASALAAKARCIMTCEEEPGAVPVRKVRVRTNLTASPRPLLLEVADPKTASPGAVDYFRIHDVASAYPIGDFLPDSGDWITKADLARKLGDDRDGDDRPTRPLRMRADELIQLWVSADLATTRPAARKSVEVRRIVATGTNGTDRDEPGFPGLHAHEG